MTAFAAAVWFSTKAERARPGQRLGSRVLVTGPLFMAAVCLVIRNTLFRDAWLLRFTS